VASFSVGRVLGTKGASVVPRVVAVATAGALVWALPDLGSATGGPTGYANANATVALLAAVCAAALAASDRRHIVQVGFASLALALVAAAVASGSLAAAAIGAGVGFLAAGSVVTHRPSVVVAGGLLLAAAALGVTALAAATTTSAWDDDLHGRPELWRAALDTMQEQPLRGAGPGEFADAAGVADTDLRWAHHEYLQQGAEQGLPGLLLLVALVAWGFAALDGVSSIDPIRAVAGSAALTVVAVHAALDHVLHHPLVPLTLAVVLGWATRGAPAFGRPSSPPSPVRRTPG